MNKLITFMLLIFSLMTLNLAAADKNATAESCQIEEEEMLHIESAITNLLDTEITKNTFEFTNNRISVELTIDEQGVVSDARFIQGKVDKSLVSYVENIVLGWQIKDLNPTNNIKLIIPLMVL